MRSGSKAEVAMFTASQEAKMYNERFVALLRARTWIRRVAIMRQEDACSSCQSLRQVVDRRDLPDLPYPHCRRPDGCRCWFMPWFRPDEGRNVLVESQIA